MGSKRHSSCTNCSVLTRGKIPGPSCVHPERYYQENEQVGDDGKRDVAKKEHALIQTFSGNVRMPVVPDRCANTNVEDLCGRVCGDEKGFEAVETAGHASPDREDTRDEQEERNFREDDSKGV